MKSLNSWQKSCKITIFFVIDGEMTKLMIFLLPGGQAVAKTNNCVVLKHKPTNIIVKNHETRSLKQNREQARKLMIVKLDNHFNKDDSVENQHKRLELVKNKKAQSKSEKLRKLKLEFKEANKNQDLD